MVRRLRAGDGSAFDAVPDGSFVPGPGHEESEDGRCAVCGASWPCESGDRVTVWYEDEERPDDAVELYRLIQVEPPEPDTVTKETEPSCWCHGCAPEFDPDLPFSMNFRGMVLCPDCGNKRCPKANHHDNACTGSNDTGQPGSAYQ